MSVVPELSGYASSVSQRKGTHRLQDLALDFVSLVPAGDDPLAQVVISKADPEGSDLYVPDSIGTLVDKRKNPGQNTPHEYVNTSGEKHGDTKCDVCGQAPNSPMHTAKRKRVNKSGDGTSVSSTLNNNTSMEDHMAVTTVNKADLAPEVAEYIEGLENEVTLLSDQIEKAEADNETLTEKVAEFEGNVSKSDPFEDVIAKADPVVRSLIEKQQAEIAETQRIAKAERDARLDREYLAKAEEMPALPSDKNTLAGLLRRAAEALTPEDTAEVEKMLRAANAQIAKSHLFGEVGSVAKSDIESSVEAQAEELRKNDPSLTLDQAVVKVYESNPELANKAMNGEEN